MTKREIIEENVLQAVDIMAEHSSDQTTKVIADLFKSMILKKYKTSFDQELAQKRVHKKNIDKAVDFCYSDVCVSIRQLPELDDIDKGKMIKEAQNVKGCIKKTVEDVLVANGIVILS